MQEIISEQAHIHNYLITISIIILSESLVALYTAIIHLMFKRSFKRMAYEHPISTFLWWRQSHCNTHINNPAIKRKETF